MVQQPDSDQPSAYPEGSYSASPTANLPLLALSQISHALIQLRPLEELGQYIIATIEQMFSFQFGAVLLLDEQGNLSPLALSEQGRDRKFVEQDKQYVRSHQIRIGKGITGWVAENGLSVRTGDVRKDPRYYALRSNIRSELCVPIRFGDETLGVLNIETPRPNAFTAEDQMILEAIAPQIGIAIHNTRLYEQVRHHANALELEVAKRTVDLRETNVQLQDEVARHKKTEESLRQSVEELYRRNEDLDAFAHTAAHDLKNPLSLILGYGYLLDEICSSLPDEQVQEGHQFISALTRAADKMTSIIDSLLLLAGTRYAPVEFETLDMSKIVAAVLDQIDHLRREHAAAIHAPEQWPRVLGYRPWVDAVWTNYISNAIKYGGTPPEIELGCRQEPDGMWHFWVSDNGPGLTDEQQARLFFPFTRFHENRAAGHGLGLSIVKRIVEQLGGIVQVESEIGHGSTFSFTLPPVPA